METTSRRACRARHADADWQSVGSSDEDYTHDTRNGESSEDRRRRQVREASRRARARRRKELGELFATATAQHERIQRLTQLLEYATSCLQALRPAVAMELRSRVLAEWRGQAEDRRLLNSMPAACSATRSDVAHSTHDTAVSSSSFSSSASSSSSTASQGAGDRVMSLLERRGWSAGESSSSHSNTSDSASGAVAFHNAAAAAAIARFSTPHFPGGASLAGRTEGSHCRHHRVHDQDHDHASDTTNLDVDCASSTGSISSTTVTAVGAAAPFDALSEPRVLTLHRRRGQTGGVPNSAGSDGRLSHSPVHSILDQHQRQHQHQHQHQHYVPHDLSQQQHQQQQHVEHGVSARATQSNAGAAPGASCSHFAPASKPRAGSELGYFLDMIASTHPSTAAQSAHVGTWAQDLHGHIGVPVGEADREGQDTHSPLKRPRCAQSARQFQGSKPSHEAATLATSTSIAYASSSSSSSSSSNATTTTTSSSVGALASADFGQDGCSVMAQDHDRSSFRGASLLLLSAAEIAARQTIQTSTLGRSGGLSAY